MRATNLRYCTNEKNVDKHINKAPKKRKSFKTISVSAAIAVAAVLLIPTTTLAPDVDAFEDSRAASLSVGDIDDFALIITDNCVVPTTEPVTQEPTTVAAKSAVKETKAAATEVLEESEEKSETEPQTTKAVSEVSEIEKSEVTEPEQVTESSENSSTSVVQTDVSYAGSYLVSISNPDTSYSPSPVSLSAYDRAKLERLVMGEAGSMGYTGCALVAQSVRDAMNRSNTTSIDRIISEYKYYAPTNKEPNSDVKNAVSYIFDRNGSAVQHRILCFYTGSSGWHETQQFIVSCGNVRFFDLWY